MTVPLPDFHLQQGFGSKFGINAIIQGDPHYTLFKREDLTAWLIFSCVFLCLIVLDNHCNNNKTEQLTVGRAIRYTMFWIAMAFCFCGWVYLYYGHHAAAMWMSGYMLEWMLSFDNLFVFHLIFTVYGTPEHLKHRPLYLGICGAVVFRLAFIFIGEYLMHTMVLTHFVFGGFLVYTGINTVMADDDDDDPSQNALVQWLQAKLPFIQFYDQSGAFFVRVPVNEAGEVVVQQTSGLVPPSTPSNAEAVEPLEAGSPAIETEGGSYGTVDTPNIVRIKSGSKSAEGAKWQTRATMLFLVVCCLEISDLIFAVDSVSAIVAQVNDLFLAFTSAVFAMLGLRATFFIIDVLVHMFSLLKYGVAAVLVFIGVKLCLSHVYPISPHCVVLFLFLAIGGSMMASVVAEELEKKAEGEHFSDVDERVEKVKNIHNSPIIAETIPCAA